MNDGIKQARMKNFVRLKSPLMYAIKFGCIWQSFADYTRLRGLCVRVPDLSRLTGRSSRGRSR